MKQIELPPIKESSKDFERIESRIKSVFRRYLYQPILRELNMPFKTMQNSRSSLLKALQTGRITASLDGEFSGQFDAESSKALRRLGAKWDNKSKTFKMNMSELPMEYRSAISTATARFEERIDRIVSKNRQNLPAEIADMVKTKDVFVTVLKKTDEAIGKTLEKVKLNLSTKDREKIADEWSTNMKLWINNFAEEEIVSLRESIAQSVFAGKRYETIVKSIQKSYGVTASKAKFLARQETALMMAKFKEIRYTKAGINHYKWRCVAGSANHPVRPSHKILDGKIFTWQNPPITTAPDQPARRNNPGQDYNCRCMAVPIVKV